MDSIKKVDEACKSVLKLTGQDFAAVEEMAKKQENFVHPLKHATQAKYNKMGQNNLKILQCLKDLQEAIKLNEKPATTKNSKI